MAQMIDGVREVLDGRNLVVKDGEELRKKVGDPVESYREDDVSLVVIYSVHKGYLLVELSEFDNEIIVKLEQKIGRQISFMLLTASAKVCVWADGFEKRNAVYEALRILYKPAF